MKTPRNKEPSRAIKDRQVKEKAALLEQLEKIPIVQIACAKAGVARTTYYRWLNEDKNFHRRVEESKQPGIDSINDLAESAIIKKVQEGDISAAKYWLSHNHPNYHVKSRPPEKLEDIRIIRLDS